MPKRLVIMADEGTDPADFEEAVRKVAREEAPRSGAIDKARAAGATLAAFGVDLNEAASRLASDLGLDPRTVLAAATVGARDRKMVETARAMALTSQSVHEEPEVQVFLGVDRGPLPTVLPQVHLTAAGAGKGATTFAVPRGAIAFSGKAFEEAGDRVVVVIR